MMQARQACLRAFTSTWCKHIDFCAKSPSYMLISSLHSELMRLKYLSSQHESVLTLCARVCVGVCVIF